MNENRPDVAGASTSSATRLGSTAARGAALVLTGQGARFIIQTVGLVLLARYVTPESFGLVAMVVALIGIGDLLRDMGLSTATMQAESMSSAQKSNLFWINSAVGFALCLVVICFATPISLLYGREELRNITLVLAGTFALNGFATQFRALMARDLRYGWIVGADISSVMISYIVAIGTALAGYEYWAVVSQMVVQSSVSAVVCVVGCRWWPGLPRRHSGTRKLIGFGALVAATQAVGYVSRNIDSALIGIRYGATTVGLYDRAFQILMLPLNQIQAPATNIAVPVLSKLRSDYSKYCEFLLRGQLCLLYAVTSAFSAAWLIADWAIPFGFGSAWSESVSFLRILLIGGCFQAAIYVAYWVFITTGRVRDNLKFALASRGVWVILIVLGAYISPHAVAVMYVLGTAISWPMGIYWCSKDGHAPARLLFLAGGRVILLMASSLAITCLISAAIWDTISWYRAVLQLMIFSFATGAIAASIPAYRRDVAQLREVALLVLNRKK